MKHMYLVGILWSPDHFYGSFSDWVFISHWQCGFRSDACACGQVLLLCSFQSDAFTYHGPERLSDSFCAYLANKRTSAAACFRDFMVSVFTWEWAQFQLLISYGLRSRVVISSAVSVICTWFQYPHGLFPFSKRKEKQKCIL